MTCHDVEMSMTTSNILNLLTCTYKHNNNNCGGDFSFSCVEVNPVHFWLFVHLYFDNYDNISCDAMRYDVILFNVRDCVYWIDTKLAWNQLLTDCSRGSHQKDWFPKSTHFVNVVRVYILFGSMSWTSLVAICFSSIDKRHQHTHITACEPFQHAPFHSHNHHQCWSIHTHKQDLKTNFIAKLTIKPIFMVSFMRDLDGD